MGKPENVKVTINQKENTLKIDYDEKTGNSFYKMSKVETLPKFVLENNLFKEIKCIFEKGQVKIELPEDPKMKQKEIEAEKEKNKDTELETEAETVAIEIVDEDENEKHDEKHDMHDSESVKSDES